MRAGMRAGSEHGIEDFLIEVQIRGLHAQEVIDLCESASMLLNVCVCMLVRDSCYQMAQTEGSPKSSYCLRIMYSRDLKSPDL